MNHQSAPFLLRLAAGCYEWIVLLTIGLSLNFFWGAGFYNLGAILIVCLIGFYCFQTRFQSPKKLVALALFSADKPATLFQQVFRLSVKYALAVCILCTLFPATLAHWLAGSIDQQIWTYYLIGSLVFLVLNLFNLSPYAPAKFKGMTFYDWFAQVQVLSTESRSGRILMGKITAFLIFAIVLNLLLSTQIGFIGDLERVKVSQLKSHMHQLQTMAETYLVDHQVYPKNLKILQTEAKKQGYWKELKNPFKANQAVFEMFEVYENASPKRSYMIFFIRMQDAPLAGQVLYQFKAKNQAVIYGLDGQGMLLKDKGRVFSLLSEH